MRIGTLATTASALALGLAAWVMPIYAQGPLYDSVRVNLPYTVTVGNTTLQPGEYYIHENTTPGKSYVLAIFADNGKREFETQAMTIRAYKVDTPDDTTVILHHYGNDYYFDRIWIQGKNYGYEFPLPANVKERERERMQAVCLAATYQAVAPVVAQAPPPPPPAEQPAPPPEVAQEQPAPAPAPAPAPPMPKTASGWTTMLLAGFGLGSAGLLLRRRFSAGN
jgi:hypothetical protein